MEGLLGERFSIQGELGRGGMGVVVKAHDTLLDRPVAIKMVSRDLVSGGGMEATQIIQRFLIEARAAAKLAHPNVVTLYDVVDASPPYIVMEFVDGKTVRDLVEEGGAFELSKACDICAQVAKGLQAAHAQGMIHRDIKPENVIISGDKAKILDFGLAQLQKLREATKKEPVLGTPGYMAPEQILGQEATPASDIFATACVFVYSLIGRDLFDGADVKEILTKVVKEDPDLSEVPIGASLRPVLTRALSKNPADRPTAEELAAAMELGRSEAPDRYGDFFDTASEGGVEGGISVPGIAVYEEDSPQPVASPSAQTRQFSAVSGPAVAGTMPPGATRVTSPPGPGGVAGASNMGRLTMPPAAGSSATMPPSATSTQSMGGPVGTPKPRGGIPTWLMIGGGAVGFLVLIVLALWLLSAAFR
jgi:serine/threonine protein kinase